MQLVTVSPKGQITIPKSARDALTHKHLLFEMKGSTIILRPITIQYDDVDIEDFGDASVDAGEPKPTSSKTPEQRTHSSLKSSVTPKEPAEFAQPAELKQEESATINPQLQTTTPPEPQLPQSPAFDFWSNPLDDIYEKFYAAQGAPVSLLENRRAALAAASSTTYYESH